MYYNIVYTDLVIKGLVRVFVSFQKEKVFINLKKPNKVFVVMQTRHTRLEKFILAELVSVVIYSCCHFYGLHRPFLAPRDKFLPVPALSCSLWVCPALAHAPVHPNPLLLYRGAPSIPRRAIPGSVPANGVSQSFCSITLFCTGEFLRGAPNALVQLRDPRMVSAGTEGLRDTGQPVPVGKSVCPGTKG